MRECVRVDGMNVYTTLAYPPISSFRTIHKHAHTHILKPFKDSELTGLKVDIAKDATLLGAGLRCYTTKSQPPFLN